jgi:hypothetical protein
MTDLPVTFVNHFVAFVDILGFSEMVRHDAESPDGGRLFVEKLFDIHAAIRATVIEESSDIELTQFSDSVVLSMPLERERFSGFLKTVAGFQLLLLKEGLLCRGGVAYGKHFSRNAFMFSDAMINAYRLESAHARYPRIVVSSDLVELYPPPTIGATDLIVVEDDGIAFIDYLRVALLAGEDLNDVVANFGTINRGAQPAVREKIRWLLQYADWAHGSTLAPARFSRFDT